MLPGYRTRHRARGLDRVVWDPKTMAGRYRRAVDVRDEPRARYGLDHPSRTRSGGPAEVAPPQHPRVGDCRSRRRGGNVFQEIRRSDLGAGARVLDYEDSARRQAEDRLAGPPHWRGICSYGNPASKGEQPSPTEGGHVKRGDARPRRGTSEPPRTAKSIGPMEQIVASTSAWRTTTSPSARRFALDAYGPGTGGKPPPAVVAGRRGACEAMSAVREK